MSKNDKNMTSADLEESARQLQEAAKKEREAARMEREAAKKEKEAAKLLRQAAKQAAKEEKEAKKKAKQNAKAKQEVKKQESPEVKETEKAKAKEQTKEIAQTKEKTLETSSTAEKQKEEKQVAETDATESAPKVKQKKKKQKKKKQKKNKQNKKQTEAKVKQEKAVATTAVIAEKKEKEPGNIFKYLNYILITLIILTILLAGLFLFTQTSSGKQTWSKIQQTSLFGGSSKNSDEETPQIDPNALKVGSNHINSADEYAYSTQEIREYITDQKETEEKIVFLTFDDGVASGYTDKILDTLSEYGVHGTFFLIGNNLHSLEEGEDYVHELMHRQINEGHAVAIHTMSHNMDLLYPGRVPNMEQIVTEAQEEQALLKSILGEDFNTSVFRYPGGHMSWADLEGTDDALEANGLQWIDWNASVGDAEPDSRRPKDLDSMLEFHSTSSKDFPESTIKVVLMHDTFGKDLTVEVLPQIIEYYQNEGYKFGILE